MPINWDAPIEIRDSRNGNWFWVDKQVWEHEKLTSSDKVVYGTLAYFANQKTQQAFPQMTTLENHCKLSRRQVYRSTKALEKLKFIHIQRQKGKPNIYTLSDNWKHSSDKLSVVTNNTKSSDTMSHEVVTNNTSNNNIYNKNKITTTDENNFPYKDEVIRIADWAYTRALKIPSIPREKFMEMTVAAIKHAGYELVRREYEYEENAITFLTNIKNL